MRLTLQLALIVVYCTPFACNGEESADASGAVDLAARDATAPDHAPWDRRRPDLIAPCPQYAQPVKVSGVDHGDIVEASGIVASRRNPGVMWTHNDSGDSARLFAFDIDKGKHLGVYGLGGVTAYDFEDLATGPGPKAGAHYLYVGDIGDNGKVRTSVQVHVVAEPAVSTTRTPKTVELSGVVTLSLRYPDGAHDAETLLVDPINGDLYVVVKSLDGVSPVYRSAAPHDQNGTRTLIRVALLTFGKGNLANAKFTMTTAGDVSADGSEVLIRTYYDVFLWRRPAGQLLFLALAGKPCALPVAVEPQGEAVAFDAKTHSYYTLSENKYPPLFLYKRQ